MALTTGQRAKIRLYCGWSARFRQTDSRLEQSMNALDSLQGTDPDTFNEVVGILASLADIEAKLVDSHKRMKAEKLGTIDLPKAGELGMLRSEGRRFAGRLAALLGVEIRQDVFAGRGPSWFSSQHGIFPGRGTGNLPPLG